MKIDPSETLLKGQWIIHEGHAVADDISKRIFSLMKSHLIKLGSDASGWDSLYRDPTDGRLWEQTYPQSEMHGGGPPQLRCLTFEEAEQKYGANTCKH